MSYRDIYRYVCVMSAAGGHTGARTLVRALNDRAFELSPRTLVMATTQTAGAYSTEEANLGIIVFDVSCPFDRRAIDVSRERMRMQSSTIDGYRHIPILVVGTRADMGVVHPTVPIEFRRYIVSAVTGLGIADLCAVLRMMLD